MGSPDVLLGIWTFEEEENVRDTFEGILGVHWYDLGLYLRETAHSTVAGYLHHTAQFEHSWLAPPSISLC